MKDTIIEKVRELLQSGKISGFVAYKEEGEHIGPHVFTRPDELDILSLGDRNEAGDTRYSLVSLLNNLAAAYPNDTWGILVRGCGERAINRLMQVSRVASLSPDRVVMIGMACPAELAEKHKCEKPWPDALVAGEPAEGVFAPAGEDFWADPVEQLEEWADIFNRCIKCFGCRNNCPVCDCHECTMEVEALVPQRELPIVPNFLLTRAVHMIDRCVYCGLCEESCPADIPLTRLYRLVAGMAGMGLMAGTRGSVIKPKDDLWMKQFA